MKKNLLLFCFFFLISVVAFSQDFDKPLLDSLLSYIDVNHEGMGTLSVFKNGEEIYNKSIGFANVEEQIPLTKNTLLGVGSISKTYTAAIIFSLIEKGKISLKQKLSSYYPSVKNADIITIEQLLYHKSGLFNFTEAPDYLTWNTLPHSRNALLQKFEAADSNFNPGEKSAYSNTNYVLLGLIAEKVTNQPLDVLLNNKIFKPCGCRKTDEGNQNRTPNDIAFSYGKSKGWERSTVTHSSIPVGAGSIYATASDVNRFLHCLFNGQLISEESLSKMKTIKDGYGAGLFSFPFYDKKALGHTGGIDGFSSMASYFPKDSLAFTYISNGVSYPVNDIMIGALSIYYNRPYDFPEFKQAMSIESKALDKYVGTYGSETFPLKITITKEKDSLYGQATGQPSFPLSFIGDHTFIFAPAQLSILFDPKRTTLTLKQGGGEYLLQRE